ncbi:MAG: hypothetical protein ACOYOK_13280 [Pseudobdellovibrionaceae bacterium]
MALETGSPIIPTLIIGAEESHINLKQLKLSRFLKNIVLPVPLNIIPLPVKWKIKFLEPYRLPYPPEAANDPDLVHELAEQLQDKMQEVLNKEVRSRKSFF